MKTQNNDQNFQTAQRSSLLNRRSFLNSSATGLGAIALADLLSNERLLAETKYDPENPFAERSGHSSAKAKRVVMVFCAGACSQLETFDYKPELEKRDGQAYDKIPPVTFQGPSGKLAKPQYKFKPRGNSGMMVSEMIPHLAELVDDFSFVHSLTSKSNTHGPAENFLSTGFVLDGFPSIGAWISYALGTENQNLPAFVAIPDPRGVPQASVNNWGPGFLPAVFQGTPFNSRQPIRNLIAPSKISKQKDLATRNFLELLNREHLKDNKGDSNLAARIASYELAARMQLSVPKISNLSDEPGHILQMYDANSKNANKASFAKNCILARRLLENGVRFVQLFNGAYASGGKLNWDGHSALRSQYDVHGEIMDQPVAALYKDLKQRGLLEDTLFVWCTEFGRMPMFQKGAKGRDHNPDGFTAFFAGAGVKHGVRYGETDELGFKAIENPRPLHDFHATILHLLGLDHEKLTFRYNGIDRRLTDVHGEVIHEVLG